MSIKRITLTKLDFDLVQRRMHANASAQAEMQRRVERAQEYQETVDREGVAMTEAISMVAMKAGEPTGIEFGRCELKHEREGEYVLELHPKPQPVTELQTREQKQGA